MPYTIQYFSVFLADPPWLWKGTSGLLVIKRVVYFVRQEKRTAYLAGVYFYVDDVISLYFVLIASIL